MKSMRVSSQLQTHNVKQTSQEERTSSAVEAARCREDLDLSSSSETSADLSWVRGESAEGFRFLEGISISLALPPSLRGLLCRGRLVPFSDSDGLGLFDGNRLSLPR